MPRVTETSGSPEHDRAPRLRAAVGAGRPGRPGHPGRGGTGRARDVVRAGRAAYVVGWHADGSAALWRIDPDGSLEPRTPVPGQPANPGLGRSDLLDPAFDGPRTGLAITRARAGTQLFATDDGARTWRWVRLPALDRPSQLAVGGGAADVLTCRSRDLSVCRRPAAWSIDPAGGGGPRPLARLPARSGGTAFAAYGDTLWVRLGLGAGRGIALRSVDAGRSWRPDIREACLWDDLVATSSSTVWDTCGTGMLEHFTRQVGDGPPVAVVGIEAGGTTSSALLPISATTAYVIIDRGLGARVELTRDGGRTVHPVGAVPRVVARAGFTAAVASLRVGYLVTLDGRLYRTDDGARTWRRVTRSSRGRGQLGAPGT